METQIVVYCCHGDEKRHKTTVSALNVFAEHINALTKKSLSIVDGNIRFPSTRRFLHKAINQSSNNGVCSFDSILNHISKVLRSKTFKSEDNEEAWGNYSFQEMATSLSGYVVIVADNSIHTISGYDKAHGVSYDRYAFLIKDYKNILWHELAHLIGANDHYDRETKRANSKCLKPDLCFMQWDPAGKPCVFCESAIIEIDNYFKGKSKRNINILKK